MKIVITVITIILLISCSNNHNEKTNPDFEKRIEIDMKGNLDLRYQWTKAVAKNAELILLDNGFDSFCVRFWYSFLETNDNQVIEIKRKNNIWSGNYYHLKLDSNKIKLLYPNGFVGKQDTTINYYYYINSAFTTYLKYEERRLQKNQIEWKNITDTLLAKNFIKLPDCVKIRDYQIHTHNSSVTIEIATNQYYRIFSYSSLISNEEDKFGLKVSKAVKLLEEKFGIHPLYQL